MIQNKIILDATMQIVEMLLETDKFEDALNNGLELIVKGLKCEEGVMWISDEKTGRLYPLICIGPADISNISIENNSGITGHVVTTGESVVIPDVSADPRYDGSVFDDYGLAVRSMICVPLKTTRQVMGCIQIINSSDSSVFSEESLMLCQRMASLSAMVLEEKDFHIDTGPEKEVIIKLRNIIKEFPSGDGVLRVLKGINLDIYKGEFLVILGESGCGKSTLVNIIGGMDSLTDGELYVNGKDFSHPSDDELTQFRREYMGFVFQQYNLMPNLTALENIRFIAEIAKDPMSSKDALEMVGLSDRAGNYPSALSGGQQQRISIARAIVKNPQIIFADEPTAALDYSTSIEVLHIFEEIVKKKGSTVVMITHNPEIAKMADRVIKLRYGLVFSIRRNLTPAKAEELVW